MTNNEQTTSTSRRAPSIRIAFQTLGRTIRHGYDNVFTLALVGLFWLAGALLILPLGSVTAALHRITKPMTEERATHWRAFFTHLRADLRWSSALLFVLLFVLFVLQGNIGFYNAAPAAPLRFIAAIFLGMLFVWLGVTLYAFPLALRQQEQRLRLTLRNAAVMVLANAPGTLVSLVLLTVLTTMLALLPPLFVLIPGVIALWSEENARLLLVASGHVKKDEFADKDDIPFAPTDDKFERRR